MVVVLFVPGSSSLVNRAAGCHENFELHRRPLQQQKFIFFSASWELSKQSAFVHSELCVKQPFIFIDTSPKNPFEKPNLKCKQR